MNIKKINIYSKLLIFVLILTIHVFILTRIIFFPYPENFIYPYLTVKGLIPYKQIFDQHFPGLMFFPVNFYNLGMINEIIARWWLIGITLTVQLLIFIVSLRIFRDFKKTILANILFLVWHPFLEGWVLWIDNILPIFYLPAFYFSYRFISDKERNYKYTLMIGVLLGIAALFKQVVLPLAGLVLLLLLYYEKNLRTCLYFLGGFLPIPTLMVGYFWSIGVVKEFWYWTVTFNITTFATFGRKMPFFSGLIRIIGVYSPSLLLPLIRDKKLAVCLIVFILGSLLSAYARFDFVHFQPSLPFVVIATSAVLFKLWENYKTKMLVGGYIGIIILWLSIFYRGHWGDKVFFFDKQTKAVVEKIKMYAKVDEEIFLFGPVAHVYQMSDTLPAGKIFVFQFPWFMMETEDKFVEVLKTNKPKLVVRDRTVEIEGKKITDFAQKLDKYIEENYQRVEAIGLNEFMIKK